MSHKKPLLKRLFLAIFYTHLLWLYHLWRYVYVDRS